LQDAKNRFSEVVEKALHKGPQVVTRRGVETVVIMSVDEFHQLTGMKTTIVEFFRNSPLGKTKLNLERNKETPRKINL
jgi:prevent-host-death family protein